MIKDIFILNGFLLLDCLDFIDHIDKKIFINTYIFFPKAKFIGW